MSYWDTDSWPSSKCALCNVLEQVIRAGGGPFKGHSVRRFRRYVESGMTPGGAASKAAPGVMPLALALQERALRTGRGPPFPLTNEQESSIERLARQVFEEMDRLKREKSTSQGQWSMARAPFSGINNTERSCRLASASGFTRLF